ncbi:Translation elongation factor P Lys34:lysine transferase [Bathymodiolus heckerae thiotrophic gill symbiont]|uniref:EF-P lysine aminoacylase EpmA n=1 Tax=Bathymodiolus heckerae thiotrophic gill symbiont TaxID=1052212 RepID=UPI0010AF81A2|nr:EF-P lysine aminoacylase EpmA [Bathymodiolus heckerae thiotrophic gill symbiont]CAC9591348.1 Translation elongation factor P Lys34--(R)-beta-lysine ligase [uncultured Gammaproteobacteria bacterium]SHN90583.1 Translation elongation factor P Lys34:lysine transferase [Bathymodiolus heckerae thiotrophic gill symbiont]
MTSLFKLALDQKADVLKKIRQFFDDQSVLEVQTTSLLNVPVTDVYIDSISIQINLDIQLKTQYLHTSPELEMKKLIAQGSGDIYQICQVYRDNEQGSQNFNEFTMLEYYRLNFDSHQLMGDVISLIKVLGIKGEVHKLSYAQAFEQFAQINILNTNFDELKVIAKSHQLSIDFDWIEDLQIFLFTALCEPKLEQLPICFIYDYPAVQSALARVEGQVAHRFELYLSGMEVANGYDELQDAQAYQQIFDRENSKRKQLNKPCFELDIAFLKQLENSLPQCSGVAVGIDRLISQIAKSD